METTKTSKLIGKILIFIIIIAASCYPMFFLLIITVLTGNKVLLTSLFIISILGTLLLFISIFIKRITRKKKLYLWLSLIAVVFSINAANQAYRSYDNSFTRLNEQAIEIYKYRPFKEDSIVATLDKPSTLKLDQELPILDGARALYPVYAAFAQAVYPAKDYSFYDSAVSYHNTIDAYKRLINKTADIIFVVAPSKQQIEQAKQAQVNMVFTPIGKEAFVFFVNKNNPINNLSTQQIKDIYSGKITNWKQLGGDNSSIKAFQRNEGSGSQTAFLKFMQETPIMPPPKEDVIRGMGGIINQTADYKNYGNAIGFSFRFFTQKLIANDEIKLLSIDGIYPSLKTIKSGEYPLTTQFFAATLADNNKLNVKQLLNWILSPQGQELIQKTGYVPID